MKTLVIFYSYTGKTREIAKETAEREKAELLELKEKKARSKFAAYTLGCFAAMRQKEAKLLEFDGDFSAYDKIIIMMPVWASFPAPPFNNIIKLLPSGKDIELVLTSQSGDSSGSAEKTKALIAAKGCNVVKYEDIKV